MTLPRPALLVAAATLALTLLAPAPSRAAWPTDPLLPLLLSNGSGQEIVQTSCLDNSGGFFVVWADNRAGNYDVYAQHVSADGTLLWGPSGLAIASGTGDQYYGTPVSDDAGGVIIGWINAASTPAIWAQRFNAAGTAQWTAGGVRVATQTNAQSLDYKMVSDGANGAEFAWVYATTGTNSDIYAQRVTSAGIRAWGSSGLAVCTQASNQDMITAAADLSSGLWLLWRDARNGTNDLYAQHLTSSGATQLLVNGALSESYVPGPIADLTAIADGQGGMIAAFTLMPYSKITIESLHLSGSSYNSLPITPYSNSDGHVPTLASDGQGGAFLFWQDNRNDTNYDIYGTRLSNSGTLSPGWTDQGTLIAGGATPQVAPSASSDGQGGVIVAWLEGGSGGQQIVAKRYRPDGFVASGWSSAGNAVATTLAAYGVPLLMPTGDGGAFVTYYSGTTSAAAYAQRMDRFGQLGDPSAKIVSVRDVPNDQGGRVRVSWTQSPLEQGFSPVVRGYQLWRQVPQAAAQAALRSGVAVLATERDPEGRRTLRTTSDATTTYYWEYVAGVPAQGFEGYSMTAATTGDSVAGSNPRTLFMVESVTSFNSPGPTYASVYWYSAPDSGYSVDNLPPAIPGNFAASWSSGTGAQLTWNANSEADLAGYHLYRGASSSFVPSPANRIATSTQTWANDPGAPPSYYRLAAFDIHGNEGPSVLVAPNGVTAAGDDLPRAVALALASPNPVRGEALLRIELPEAAAVALEVYDAAGRRVRTLARGVLAAGSTNVRWGGERDNGRTAGAGLYFVRLVTGDRTLTERVVRIP